MRDVAVPVPTTAGNPYSRDTIAAWDMIPPMSVTAAQILEKIGAHAGDVTVATSTSPAWAPIFSKIAATVTDIGGIMSHAAIVSREYGLPAVVGTGFATQRVKTGQLIEVDGNEGTVRIVEAV